MDGFLREFEECVALGSGGRNPSGSVRGGRGYVSDFDGIIVGGGHNGLTCAAYLAKAGLSVAVVERNPVAGGGCATRELTLPGFRHNTHSNYHFIEEGPVPADLELRDY